MELETILRNNKKSTTNQIYNHVIKENAQSNPTIYLNTIKTNNLQLYNLNYNLERKTTTHLKFTRENSNGSELFTFLLLQFLSVSRKFIEKMINNIGLEYSNAQ